ncbi:MAG: RNA methyltransferase [Acidobacteria bacterium]|nr:RNA methyltransferase [Acidobacteriota bacterium]
MARAWDERVPIETLFIESSALQNPYGQKLARRIRQTNVPLVRLAPRLYQELTRANEPQGIGAVLRQQWSPITPIDLTRTCFWLAVESVDLPGNLGTILRSAEAAGVSGVIFIDDGADPHDPACVRATMGALFSLKLVRCTLREFGDWARARDVAIVGSSPRGLMGYRQFRCRWPSVLVIGSEREGMSDELSDLCDFVLKIPMCGNSDSINAAVAAGVLLFELAGQRPG